MKNENGFTLVELAIVLMIIGLLIGGILRGQELMENARVSSTIQQVKAYQGAKVTFMDTYSSLPGDLPTATSRVPGCTAANFCGNGDGNGMIGEPGSYATVQAGNATLPRVETTYFWKHMALAHLISGVTPSATILNPTWGESHPASKMGAGGFAVFYSTQATDWGVGHRIRLQMGPTNHGGKGTSPVSPIRARMIDEKMDDGMSSRGDVTADSHASECNDETVPGGRYLNTEEKNCIMYFNIE